MADERLNIAEQRLAFTERRLGQEESRSRKLEADLAGALHRVKQMESELSGVVHQIKESNIQWKEYKDIIEAFGKSHPIDPRSMPFNVLNKSAPPFFHQLPLGAVLPRESLKRSRNDVNSATVAEESGPMQKNYGEHNREERQRALIKLRVTVTNDPEEYYHSDRRYTPSFHRYDNSSGSSGRGRGSFRGRGDYRHDPYYSSSFSVSSGSASGFSSSSTGRDREVYSSGRPRRESKFSQEREVVQREGQREERRPPYNVIVRRGPSSGPGLLPTPPPSSSLSVIPSSSAASSLSASRHPPRQQKEEPPQQQRKEEEPQQQKQQQEEGEDENENDLDSLDDYLDDEDYDDDDEDEMEAIVLKDN